ncbi:hypothetical protein [Sulfurisphaera tokodaii]|uniref:Uncharacterized protein n=2 Tax=Sulfurisphaera tokodaii TaxID=111955 RepID=Q975T2_SULTO|nr:hypothetical protein [Sulfurisphaera tokodaii]BAB65317.1 hypothetical protein STK_03400 [Sulfurisphaera tokodaii str. 7]HII74984.1 hypothetical protein [Sulfurisphaera tokodaii]
MVFNHIEGNVNIPGEIPWEIILIYFVVAPTLLYLIARKENIIKKFTTLDNVYIGIGAAIATVWEFFIGSFLDRVIAISYIDLAFWGKNAYTNYSSWNYKKVRSWNVITSGI